MAAPLYQFFVKDQGLIRDDWLRTLRSGLIARGVPSPNVSPGSDYFIMATAFGIEAAVAMSNAVILNDQQMPDTATGTNLDRQGAIVGLSRRAAGGANGVATFSTSISPTTVTTGTQLLDPSGLRYQVFIGGTYNNGDLIPIAAVDTGFLTNLAVGVSLRWQVPPPGAASTVTVAGNGFANGADAEDDESYRARIAQRMTAFPAGGNWSYVANLANTSAPQVQGSAVYPAIQGPATFHVAVFAAPTSTNKTRVVNAAIVSGLVTGFIQGQMPEHAYSVITGTVDDPVDLAIGLSLPAAPTAPQPGPGGGWLDGTPWPTMPAANPVNVASVTSSTSFVVNAPGIAAPTAGVSRIAWISPLNWQLYTATILTSSFNSGQYTLTIDTPFVGIAAGNYIFPQSQNQAAYAAALLQWFALLGPGEKTTNASALARGYRHPLPALQWPYAVNATLLNAMTNAGPEVADAQFYYRLETTVPTSILGNAGQLTPPIPGSVTSAPNLFVPRNIAFYPI